MGFFVVSVLKAMQFQRSYTLECVRCENYKYNWLKYLAAAYIPLTALYIDMSIFTINFASPEFSGAIMFFQMVGNPTVIQFTLTFVISTLPGLVQLMRVAFSFASFWKGLSRDNVIAAVMISVDLVVSKL